MSKYIFSFFALFAFTFAAPMIISDTGSIAVAKSYKHSGGHAYHGGGHGKGYGYKQGYHKGYKKGYKKGHRHGHYKHNKYYGQKPYKYGYHKPYKKYYGYSGHYNKHFYKPKKYYSGHYNNYYKPRPHVVNNYYYKPYPKPYYKPYYKPYRPYRYGYGYGGYYNSPLYPLANLAGFLIYNSHYNGHKY